MKTMLGALLLLSCATGCIVEEVPHGREAVVAPYHRHCVGCGHVQVRGVWYERI